MTPKKTPEVIFVGKRKQLLTRVLFSTIRLVLYMHWTMICWNKLLMLKTYLHTPLIRADNYACSFHLFAFLSVFTDHFETAGKKRKNKCACYKLTVSFTHRHTRAQCSAGWKAFQVFKSLNASHYNPKLKLSDLTSAECQECHFFLLTWKSNWRFLFSEMYSWHLSVHLQRFNMQIQF